MTDQTGAGEAMELPADAPEEFNSVNEAAAYFTSLEEKRKNPPAERADTATAENELSGEDNAAAEDQPTGEMEEVDPAEVPPLELPRSWTKEQADHWKALPRVTQEYLAAQDSKASAEVRRVQNEAAETRKAAEAERTKAEQARQQYEAKLPALMQSLQDGQQAAFSDIRTVDDVQRMAAEDPFKYLQWQAHQTKLQAVNAELERSKANQEQARQSEWHKYAQSENALAAELIPELADKDKAPALLKRAAERHTELGYTQDELTALANGTQKIAVYDHRYQRLVADSLELAQIKSARSAVTAKPVPQVQRPGMSRPAGSDTSAREQTLTRKPELSVKEATELYELQSRRQRRA